MPKKIKKRRSPNSKWKDEYYVKIYDLVRQGYTRTEVAKVLGITLPTLDRWRKERPALQDAIKRAKESMKPTQVKTDLFEYIYNHLPPKVQEVWDKLESFDDEPNILRRSDLLRQQPEKIKQHLFIHTLIASTFNINEACRKVQVSKMTYDRWMITDPNFGRLVEEVLWHKKNFYEAALTGLVSQGDTSAIIFANRTMNRDRGYDQRVDHHHTGAIVHGTVDLDNMNIPLETKRQLLVAARAQLGHKDPELLEVLDATPTPAKDEADDEDDE